MEDFQGRPLDDPKNVHDFLLLRLGKLLTVQVVIQDPVIQPYRPSSPNTPLRVVACEQVERRHVLRPEFGARPGKVAEP